jgi:hypothetical protein
VGTQNEMPSVTTNGIPFDVTLVVPTSHVPFTHGPTEAVGRGFEQFSTE